MIESLPMNTDLLLKEVKAEIKRLEKVVALLEGESASTSARGKRKGRRKPMSQEARDKIAAAQKKRWAKQKKEAA